MQNTQEFGNYPPRRRTSRSSTILKLIEAAQESGLDVLLYTGYELMNSHLFRNNVDLQILSFMDVISTSLGV